MNNYNSEIVMNGSYGELWFDGDYMAEVKSFRAELNCDYEDIQRVRNLVAGKKLIGLSGEGELTMYKISSYIMAKMSKQLKAGKTPEFTLISKVDDPNSIGQERVAIYHVKFAKMTLADWERKKVGEESYSFTFEDYEILDSAQ